VDAAEEEHSGAVRLQPLLLELCKRHHLVLADRDDVHLPARDVVSLHHDLFERVTVHENTVGQDP